MNPNGSVHLQVKTPLVSAAGVSDTGRIRTENEDSIWLDEAGHFMLLCDGMGGHERGAEASQTAIKVIQKYLDPQVMSEELKDITGVDGVPTEIACLFSLVDEAIDNAATTIFERNQELKLERYMGTTVVGLVLVEGEFVLWFHVGDSRIYRWRNSSLECLTSDHSAYAEWIHNGRVGQEPGKNVITRAIGPNAAVVADIQWEKWEKSDIYILCSDGLTDMVPNDRIAEFLNNETDVDHLATSLIDAANEAGGKDNASVVVCRV
jgi:PPM family protein phosphatase